MMKKAITLFWAFVLMFSLLACSNTATQGSTTSPLSTGLMVGFGRESIMPEDFTKAHLGGGDDAKRVAKSIKDPLFITCVAFQQSEEIFLLYTMDTINSSDTFTAPAKEAVSQTTGVPAENILMCATHTHAGVSLAYKWDGLQAHLQMFNDAAAYAAKAAIKDLTVADVYHGNVETERLAYVRHYELSDGSFAGANFGNFANGTIVGHSAQADGQFQLIKFVREGKKDVVMMNFPAHATFAATSDTYISADYPCPTRDYIEQNSNSLVAFFIGAAGNQTPVSDIKGEAPFNRSQYREYGAALGKYAVDALPNLTKAEDQTMKRTSVTYTGNANKDKLELLPYAQSVVDAAKKYGNIHEKTVALARKHGFVSYYEANAVITRSKAPDTYTMTVNAMTIGDVGFVFAPYEMFAANGVQIKEGSGCPTTFIATCAGGVWGYIPDPRGVEVGSYEACITKFEYGTGEKLAELFIDTLVNLRK